MTTTKILLSSSPDNLRAALSAFTRAGTVEAEYGDVLVEGHSDVEDDDHTLAHHGPRSDNPPPCLAKNRNVDEDGSFEAIGLSHVDLDALGGVLALMGRRPQDEEANKFWKLAGWVDINGPHRVDQYSTGLDVRRRLQAWWAWSEQNRCYAPRDGSVADVTDFITKAEAALHAILADDTAMIMAGQVFQRNEDDLNVKSLVDSSQDVILRRSESFCNHLYCLPSGHVQRAVVSWNPKTKAVTISLAEPIKGVSCRDVAVALWGPEAGGHAGIAGGPRTGLEEHEAAHAAAIMRCVLAGR